MWQAVKSKKMQAIDEYQFSVKVKEILKETRKYVGKVETTSRKKPFVKSK